MILLDTNVLIEILDKESSEGDRMLKALGEAGEEVGTTSINMHELLYGLKRYAKSVEKVGRLRVLPYEKQDAEVSSRLELMAEKRGRPVRRIDTMIAAVAINRSARLSTLDVKHFEQFTQDGLHLFSA
ncbi:MAG: type II toxin-antitoxin system VapC family toxin [Nitrososphaerota archaeon]|nr:type II toxin-antitoxin system VapC family toxin [Nitrososphaerota archaeon]